MYATCLGNANELLEVVVGVTLQDFMHVILEI
jgi:hypothetical protein